MKSERIYNKNDVRDFWSKASCGESLYLSSNDQQGYLDQSINRYKLEGNLISRFADFEGSRGLKVLEIGVGLGADHQLFAEMGADLYGIDLTERAINHTSNRFKVFNLTSKLSVMDAEHLEFSNEIFDYVYSWGVLHHSPNTALAITEVLRVLKPNGITRIMIYHKWSCIGFILWLRYALFTLRPFLSLNYIYAHYLESPGTKAYSKSEVKLLFKDFRDVQISSQLTHADLLESQVGQRHKGFLLFILKKIWPRWLIRKYFKNSGLFMLIEARK
jgi:ubiquinone/menaquinone biosynthesis C-methylase UbiE